MLIDSHLGSVGIKTDFMGSIGTLFTDFFLNIYIFLRLLVFPLVVSMSLIFSSFVSFRRAFAMKEKQSVLFVCFFFFAQC